MSKLYSFMPDLLFHPHIVLFCTGCKNRVVENRYFPGIEKIYLQEDFEMLIACLIAFAILVVAWLALPHSVETVEVTKPVDAPKGSTITAS